MSEVKGGGRAGVGSAGMTAPNSPEMDPVFRSDSNKVSGWQGSVVESGWLGRMTGTLKVSQYIKLTTQEMCFNVN